MRARGRIPKRTITVIQKPTHTMSNKEIIEWFKHLDEGKTLEAEHHDGDAGCEYWVYIQDNVDLLKSIAEGHRIRLKPEPAVPKMIPLGPEDFVGKCVWVRPNVLSSDIGPAIVVAADKQCVHIAGGHTRPVIYEVLQLNYERLVDGQWVKCEKEGKA